MTQNDYYVYVYLDPTKPGDYLYGDFYFTHEPFYVGKGRKNRHRIHLLKVKRGNYKNLPKYHTIKRIIDLGIEPIIIKYSENMNENDSFFLEKDMIQTIGRRDILTGPLRNLTDGGEGNGNRKFSDEHCKNISISKKGVVTQKLLDHLRSVHERMIGNKRTLGMKFSDESKKKMIESRSKAVYQIDPKNGEILREFSSIKNAEIFIGLNIKKALSGKSKKAGGFIWKYKNKNA